ncbi:transcription termination/antitermination protein NusG [Bosea lathyri]|nr:transcription termination/antitermination NusG family protein [Bosea lathyri]
MDIDLSLDWYLVYTAPRMEAKAARSLSEAGCKVFLPALHRVITCGKRLIEHDVATFPRYLFCAGMPFRRRGRDIIGDDGVSVVTVNGRPIDDIRDIDGVQEVVGTAQGWLKVPSAAVGMVANFQNDITPPRHDVLKPERSVKVGDKLTVISGPFMSFQATVIEAIGLHRADVLIDIFGRETVVTMGISQLDAA